METPEEYDFRSLSQLAQDTITDLRDDGFSDDQIVAAMCDGVAIRKLDLDQDTVEEIYHHLV